MMLCDRNAAYFNLGNIKHWPLEREAFYPFGNLGRQGAKLFIQMTKSSADINYNKKGIVSSGFSYSSAIARVLQKQELKSTAISTYNPRPKLKVLSLLSSSYD
jgi:hypothetical protein